MPPNPPPVSVSNTTNLPASLVGPPVKVKAASEFVVLIRNPKTKTLHALLNPRLGPGALASFQTAEQAVLITSDLPDLKNREYFILSIE